MVTYAITQSQLSKKEKRKEKESKTGSGGLSPFLFIGKEIRHILLVIAIAET